MQRGDQVVGAGQRLPGGELVDHFRQPVVAAVQQVEQHRLHRQTVQGQGFVEGFQFMAQVAEGLDLGHAGAALERVQIALQGLDLQAVAGIGDPGVQAAAGGLKNVVGFFQEDRHQLRVPRGAVGGRRGVGGGGRVRCLAQHRLAQRLDHRRGGFRFTAAAQRVDHVRQPVVAPMQHIEQRGRGCRLIGGAGHFVEVFQLMGEVADGADAGHAGAALEGMQVPLQGRQAVGFAVLPGGQVFAG